MLKDKNAQYKIKIRQLEEELEMTKQANSKLMQDCEFAEAKATFNAKESERVKKLCNQEVTDLKQKLFKVEFELSQMKKTREMPQLQRIDNNLTIDIDDSDEEMEEHVDEQDDEEVKNEEIQQSFPEQQQTFKCPQCPKTYVHEKRLRNHLRVHVSSQSPSTIPITLSQRGSNCTVQYKCKVAGCNFTCLYKPAFNRHTISHTLPNFKCNNPGCTYNTPYEKRLYNHLNTKHPRQANDDDDEQFSYFNDTEFHGLIQERMDGMR